jgi:hypothetical protein
MIFLWAFLSIGINAQSVPLWKIYTAIITQNDNVDPVVYVMQNDFIGEIVWKRLSTGYYTGRLVGAFLPFKTWCILECANNSVILYGNIDEVVIVTRNSSGLPSDNILKKSAVEIRVYMDV